MGYYKYFVFMSTMEDRGIRSPCCRVTRNCEPPKNGCWELNLSPLKEQYPLSTAISLQHHFEYNGRPHKGTKLRKENKIPTCELFSLFYFLREMRIVSSNLELWLEGNIPFVFVQFSSCHGHI